MDTMSAPSPDMPMVVRVAEAMKKRATEPAFNLNSLKNMPVGNLGVAWILLAQAAILAMREPTAVMVDAGDGASDNGQFGSGRHAWETMIAAAMDIKP